MLTISCSVCYLFVIYYQQHSDLVMMIMRFFGPLIEARKNSVSLVRWLECCFQCCHWQPCFSM